MAGKTHDGGRLKYLWSRLPYIALYFVASLVIIKGVHYVAYKYALPTNFFIRNLSMNVTGTVEHTDVPIRVCRDRRGSFKGDVFRTIRIIPQGKTDENARFAGRYEIKGANIDGDRCENLLITTEQFSHDPGRYIISTNFCFRSEYNRKHCIEYKSNVYEIRPSTAGDVEAKIKDLEQQIRELRKMNESANDTSSSSSTTTTTTTRNTPTQQGAKGEKGDKGDQGESAPPPEEVCTINALGIKLICR